MIYQQIVAGCSVFGNGYRGWTTKKSHVAIPWRDMAPWLSERKGQPGLAPLSRPHIPLDMALGLLSLLPGLLDLLGDLVLDGVW